MWNAATSTLLEILISIQSIISYFIICLFLLIVSEYVYFNEPGFENTINTVQGQEANNAYSNIVKYGNIKYAM